MNDVSTWLREGAEVQEGLRLLSIYRPNPHLERLLNANPPRYGTLLRKVLTPFADEIPEAQPPRKKIREDWPFLQEPDCPDELKILAADKITAYRNYVKAHEELFACVDLEKCYETAKFLLDNFSSNRQILAEFKYYEEHHRALGKHPVFARRTAIDSYQAMSPVQLMKEERRLVGAIWRIKSELKKGDKPHLDAERRTRLASKELELEAVRRLLQPYETQ